jgi:spermidine/putrescine transport system substrate-binding protein
MRVFVRWVLTAVALLGLALVAASCGGREIATAGSGPINGQLTIAAAPGYRDLDHDRTARGFEASTGVAVALRDVSAPAGKYLDELETMLDRGDPGDRSILLVSDWMAKRLYDGGFAQEIDHEDLPTVFKNLQPGLRSPAFDPERRFSVPLQGNMTGLWINTKRADFDSVVEFFDPDIAGKVTMLADMREWTPIVMLAERQEPVTAPASAWLSAIRRIKIGEEVGQIRSLTQTEYAKGLNSGKLIAAVGRSVDAPLMDNPDVEWVKPAQGCELSSLNMVIPVGAPNTAAALAWMDYVYRPEVAADITERLVGVSPVKGVKNVLEARESQLAQDPLVFPSREIIDDCTDQPIAPDPKRLSRAWRKRWTE